MAENKDPKAVDIDAVKDKAEKKQEAKKKDDKLQADTKRVYAKPVKTEKVEKNLLMPNNSQKTKVLERKTYANGMIKQHLIGMLKNGKRLALRGRVINCI